MTPARDPAVEAIVRREHDAGACSHGLGVCTTRDCAGASAIRRAVQAGRDLALDEIERLEREVAGHAHHESKLGRMLGEVTSGRDRAVNAHAVVTESMLGWQRKVAELERELADTRKANEILEASAVADLAKLAEAKQILLDEVVQFGPSADLVDRVEEAARRKGYPTPSRRRGRGRR